MDEGSDIVGRHITGELRTVFSELRERDRHIITDEGRTVFSELFCTEVANGLLVWQPPARKYCIASDIAPLLHTTIRILAL